MEFLEKVEDLISDVHMELKNLNREQRNKIRERFTTSIDFAYKKNDDNVILKMSESNFKYFEYYLGMEYAKENITLKIESGGSVIVIYESDCDRLQYLMDLIEEDENDTNSD